MLNEIIKGIAMKLKTIFGDGYRAYQNDIEQGLKEPCFFIDVLKPELSPLLGTRAVKRNPFDIHYFPKCAGNNSEMFGVAEKLMLGLAFITLPNGDLLRGTNMSYEVVDKVLHFFVNYNMIVYQRKEEDTMEDLTTDIGTKKG